MADNENDGVYVDELLIRGRPPGSAEPVASHVILGHRSQDRFGKTHLAVSPALTPEQAEKHGFPPDRIIKEINFAILADNDTMKQEINDLKSKLADTTQMLEETKFDRDQHVEVVRRLTDQILKKE